MIDISSERLSRKLLVALAFAGFCVYRFALTNRADPDLWGHILFGGRTAATLGVPRRDIYSFSAAGTPWVSEEWLSQVALFELYRRWGTAGLVLARAASTAGALILAYRLVARRTQSFFVRLVVFIATCAVCSLHFQYRPELVTLLGCVYFLLFAKEAIGGTGAFAAASAILLPCLLVPWSWLHGGFLMGAAVLLLTCVGHELRRRVSPSLPAADAANRRLFLMTWAALAATCANPYGTALWTRIYQTMTMSAPRQLIGEWQPAWAPGHLGEAVCLAAYAAALLLRIAAADVTHIDEWPLGLAGILAGAISVRHLPFTALFNIGSLGDCLERARERVLRSAGAPRDDREGKGFLAFNLVAAAILGAGTLASIGAITENGRIPLGAITVQSLSDFKPGSRSASEYPRLVYPKGAVEFIRRNHLSGRLWNDFNIGNYLIWHLYPECRVFIDPRAEHVYDDRILLDYMRVLRGEPGWRDVLTRYDPDLVLLQADALALGPLLKAGPWRPIYRDPDYVLLAKPDRPFVRLIALFKRRPNVSQRPPLPWVFP